MEQLFYIILRYLLIIDIPDVDYESNNNERKLRKNPAGMCFNNVDVTKKY